MFPSNAFTAAVSSPSSSRLSNSSAASGYGPMRTVRRRAQERILDYGTALTSVQRSINLATQVSSIPAFANACASQVFQQVIGPSMTIDMQLEQELDNPILDIPKIKKLLPHVQNRTIITNHYLQCIRERPSAEIKNSDKLLGAFLECGNLSEEDKKLFFSSPRLLKYVSPFLAEKLFFSMQTPPDSHALMYAIGTDRIDAVFAIAIKHNLRRSLIALSKIMDPAKIPGLIRDGLVGQLLTEDKIDALSPLFPYCTGKVGEAILAYFAQAMESSNSSLHVRNAAFEFCSHAAVQTFLTDDYSISYQALVNAFHIFWEHKESLNDQTMEIATQVAEKIFQKNQSFLNEHVYNYLTNRPTDACLCSFIGAILPTLNHKTLSLIAGAIKELAKRQDLLTDEWIEELKEESVHLWALDYGPISNGYQLIVPGTKIAKDGLFDFALARQVIASLIRSAPFSVTFNARRLADSLDGGVCSAMTLRTIKEFIRARKSSTSTLDALQKLAPHILTATPEIRAIQAAYNTIEKTSAYSSDFKYDKILALLKYENPDLVITAASVEMNLKDADSLEQLKKQFNELSDGLYFTRALCPYKPTSKSKEDGLKQEHYGHSTFLIKEGGISYYYDPSIGILQLNNPEALHMVLEWQDNRWELPFVRFYRLEEVIASPKSAITDDMDVSTTYPFPE